MSDIFPTLKAECDLFGLLCPDAIRCQNPDTAYSMCCIVSSSLFNWLCKAGFEPKIVELMGRPDFPDAHCNWGNLSLRDSYHFVVRVGSYYIDFSIRQYIPESEFPAIYNLDEIEKNWRIMEEWTELPLT